MVLNLSRLSKFQMYHILRAYKSDVTDSSFNPKLIRKYKRLLDDYWNPSGKALRFHEINKILVPEIYNSFFVTQSLDIDKLIPRSEFQRYKVLDIGCGGGITSESLAQLDFNVVGIDPNPDLIHVAQSHQMKSRPLFDKTLSYYCTTVEEFVKLHPKEFDVIVISEVLEYMPFWKKKQFLHLCTSLCKDDGKVFITTITESYLAIIRRSIQLSVLGLFRCHCLSGISDTALATILRACNCSVRMTRGLDFLAVERKFEFKTDNPPWTYILAIKRNDVSCAVEIIH